MIPAEELETLQDGVADGLVQFQCVGPERLAEEETKERVQWIDDVAIVLSDALILSDLFIQDAVGVAEQRDEAATIATLSSSHRAPNANAHAERFVRSIKEECLHRIVPLGERHYRHAVYEFVTHYHRERPHQGRGNALLESRQPSQSRGRITRRPRLGGLLNFYARAA